ncbi:MAG TPA: hypothetical protein VE843_06515 [Ktedonobacteraceae bacterium]|jgi:hypothetical protein|nr:hypothetical protein [Ktedonobacteraceae bacterium]
MDSNSKLSEDSGAGTPLPFTESQMADMVVYILTSWNEMTARHPKLTPTVLPNAIAHARRLPSTGLYPLIASFVEVNPEDWMTLWEIVVDEFDRNQFLQGKVYSFVPTISWVFRPNKNGETGLQRILDGTYSPLRNGL